MINNIELIDKIKSYNKFLNSESLSKAYNFALDAHQNQKREEGVPYIIHPVAVANILTELKLDSATITTGLLHDTIEDTNVTYETVKKEFGEEVANLVDGVTKLSALENKASEDSKAENFRKLILATSKDIRVLLVKLADRLHNMRTINFIKDKEKIKRKAKETMEIYAPLADRMGMNRIRDELEDLSFSVLNKPARDLILDRLKFIKSNREDTFKIISAELIELLKSNGVHATITGREKTPFSIWRKIQNKKISLEQLTDIIGFDGDVSSVACEMEHAVNDELEESIDRLLGYPEYTHSGERVPQISRQFDPDVRSPLLPISNMPEGSSGIVEFIALPGQDIKTLDNQQISIGVNISKIQNSINGSGNPILLSESLRKRILVRLEE